MNAAEINVHRGCRVCDATVVRDCLSKQRYIRCCYAGKTGCIIHARSSRSGSRRFEGCSHSAGLAGGCGMVCASRNTDGNGRITSRVIHAGNRNSRAGNGHLCHARIIGTRTDNTVTSPRNGNRFDLLEAFSVMEVGLMLKEPAALPIDHTTVFAVVLPSDQR